MSIQDDLDQINQKILDNKDFVLYRDVGTIPNADMDDNLIQVARLGEASLDAAQISVTAADDAHSTIVTVQGIADSVEGKDIIAANAAIAAEAAGDISVSAKDLSVRSKDMAVTARNEAVTARNEAVAAKNLTLPAKDEAVTARNQAVAAKDTAVGAASTATTKAGEASQSASDAEFWAGKSQESAGEVTSVQGKTGAVDLERSDLPWVEDIAVGYVSYEDRGILRSTAPQDGDLKLIEGVGLFLYREGAKDIDDDVTCFATNNGRWLIQAESPEFAIARTEVRLDALEKRIMFGSGRSGITSVSAVSQASFIIRVEGAKVGGIALVSPPNNLSPRVSIYATVTSVGLVTIYINNPSASASGTLNGTADWHVAVIMEK